MVFVQRENGKIIGLYNNKQDGFAEEELADNNAEVLAFLNPIIDLNKLDMDTLNATLVQNGSVVRALGLVMFDEINKLRVKNGDVAYTMPQFKTALQGKMR